MKSTARQSSDPVICRLAESLSTEETPISRDTVRSNVKNFRQSKSCYPAYIAREDCLIPLATGDRGWSSQAQARVTQLAAGWDQGRVPMVSPRE